VVIVIPDVCGRPHECKQIFLITLKVSQLQAAVSHRKRFSSATRRDRTFAEIISSVEAIFEFGEITVERAFPARLGSSNKAALMLPQPC